MANNRENLEVVMNAGEKTIGAIVCWSLNGYSAPRQEFADVLVNAWRSASAAVGREPSGKAALRAAVERVGANGRHGVLFRPLKSGGFACVLESQSDVRVNHEHVCTVTAGDNGVEWSGWFGSQPMTEAVKGVKAAVEANWERKRTHVDSDELSQVLVALMLGSYRDPLLGAFNLRDRTGGVYFVPAATLPHLRAVKEAIEAASGGCRIQVLTISGTADNLAESAEQARTSFGRHLAELKQEVAEFVAESRAKSKSADKRNIGVRAERFDLLKQRVALFREILGDVGLELQSEITQARECMIGDLEAL